MGGCLGGHWGGGGAGGVPGGVRGCWYQAKSKIQARKLEIVKSVDLYSNKKPRGFMQSCFHFFVYFKCCSDFLLYFYKCSTSMAFT